MFQTLRARCESGMEGIGDKSQRQCGELPILVASDDGGSRFDSPPECADAHFGYIRSELSLVKIKQC